MSDFEKIRVMINPRSGPMSALSRLYQGFEKHWNVEGVNLTYQISRSAEDGRIKARAAVEEEVDTLFIAGGDGMINSIGSELVGTDTTLAVIPTGSGNGFARHFGISLNCVDAISSYVHAEKRAIDVAALNQRPFFVTASMAWDAALVEHFERAPMRGILPYIFSAVHGYLEYVPQPVDLLLDESENLHIEKPLILTVANMTQYGSGAIIAPRAQPDDGVLELVAISKGGTNLLTSLTKLFEGTLDSAKNVTTRRFSKLRVERQEPAPVQIDGELMETSANIEIGLLPESLNVLIPRGAK